MLLPWSTNALDQHFCDQGTFLKLCPSEASMEPPKKTPLSPEICNDIYTIYVCTIANHNSEKANKNVPFQNGGQIILYRVISIWPKFEKNTFPKEFCNEFGS